MLAPTRTTRRRFEYGISSGPRRSWQMSRTMIASRASGDSNRVMSSPRRPMADGSALSSEERGRGAAAGSRSGTGELAGERRKNPLEHRIDIAHTVDDAELAERTEMLGDRSRLFRVDAKTLAHRFGRVVLAAFGRGAAGDALDDELARHLELDSDVERLADAREQPLERLALRDIAR